MNSAIESAELIATREDEQNQALEYIKYRPFKAYPLPATALRQLPTDKLQLRVEALEALQSYANAIGEAADQGSLDQLEAAAQQLGTATGAFAGVTAAPGAAIIAPVANLGGRALGYAASDRYVREVLSVIKNTDPTVQELVDLLKQDLAPLAGGILEQAKAYAAARDDQLTLIRGDPRLTRVERYQAYQSARSDIEAQFELARAASSIDKLLEGIKSAHKALAMGTPDSTLTINRFAALSNDFAQVITAAQTEAK